MKKSLHFLWYYCYSTVLSGKIWLELEPEPKLWTKVEPESEQKINNFDSATLDYILYCHTVNFESGHHDTQYFMYSERHLVSQAEDAHPVSLALEFTVLSIERHSVPSWDTPVPTVV